MADAREQTATDFRLPVRVYYEDTDAGGVVYYANYLKYLERARTEWLRSLGHDQRDTVAQRGVLFAVRSINADYRSPARLDDLLSVELRVEAVGSASIDFAQAVRREADGAELLTARVRIACLDAASFRPARIPRDIKGDISR
ncbi:MAG: tol-pal system-associated acyl-CoA thioesterase [Halofilum sp. (in: g-proteobacteria)]|nr:tol-pal system-associated acyl-CoA thioesterase [Halofilum sp. (in: g-proteobacteria)]